MIILSIDVGIKNLALCKLKKKDDNTFEILYWNIINILDEKLKNCPKCTNFIKNKICNKIATCQMSSEENIYYFCDKKTCQKKYNSYDIKTLKQKFKKKKIKKITCKNTPLLELGTILIQKLTEIQHIFSDVNIVVIENQPVLKNPTMKSIQIILFSFFIEHGILLDSSDINNIILFSARNKLKLYDGPTVECNIKNEYNKRKFLSVEYTKYYVKNTSFFDFFIKHRKKDDLADSFIQGYYYLFKK